MQTNGDRHGRPPNALRFGLGNADRYHNAAWMFLSQSLELLLKLGRFAKQVVFLVHANRNLVESTEERTICIAHRVLLVQRQRMHDRCDSAPRSFLIQRAFDSSEGSEQINLSKFITAIIVLSRP